MLSRMRRGRVATFRPRDSGGGGPLELAKRANRGGGGAELAASLPLQRDHSNDAASLYSNGNEQAQCQRTTATFVQLRVLRPLHRATRGPPPPLSRWRIRSRDAEPENLRLHHRR